MNIKTKLLILIVFCLVACSATMMVTNRIVATKEINKITQVNLQDMARSTLAFIEKYDIVDPSKLSVILNKKSVIGKTGFLFIVDSAGNLIVHKKAQGENWIKKPFIKHIVTEKNGFHRYLSPKTKTYKVACYEYYAKKDWIIVASNFESDALAAPLNSMFRQSLIFLVPALLVVLIGSYFYISSLVIKPLTKAIEGFKDIAQGEGDLTMRLAIHQKDEIGELSKWFNTFIDKLQGIVQQIANNSESVASSSSLLSDISSSLLKNSGESSQRATNVAAASEEMSTNLNNVAAAMEESSTNANMVAVAAEEMSSTINQIAENAEKASGVSTGAVNQAKEASASMDELGAAASQIGRMTETISEISEQTNLLALNATIEAARAGEAGKGFAVVANEIKELAKQTAEATLEIKSLVEAVQATSEKTGNGISNITEVIIGVNETVGSIAAAVEEQTATTSEIAENIAQTSLGIQEVNENVSQSSAVASEITQEISMVSNASHEISGSSQEVEYNARELLESSTQLNNIVGGFKV